ncbi:TetR/AcrR family transcriptional regulator [Patulibacter defluvii]|uniref:TetR/AcrR family transcriptional regulator n=1 Tax=Patulibacter defluvii TaxID=3095358 RepID=UPI002A75B653|nr:TetR/AcrR family transcriptional regulator [Patulibacter sp. DM4]
MPHDSASPLLRPAADGDDARPRRSDAVRNRARVIEAATLVFAEQGLDAPVPEIARLAGVGKGTVYRNFPTKEHLAAAVAIARLEQFEVRLADVIAERGEPLATLRGMLVAVAAHLSQDCALGEAVDVVADDPQVLELQRRLSETVAGVVRDAQRVGAIRDDVSPADVTVLIMGVARSLPPLNHGGRPELWERYALLAFDSLRPGGSALPPGFADDDEMRLALRSARRLRGRRGG